MGRRIPGAQLLTLGVLIIGNGASGTVARFTFALAFFQLPYALIAVPVATARFPAMATPRAPASDRLARLVGDGVVTTVAGCALAGAGLLALAWPLVRLTAYGHVGGARSRHWPTRSPPSREGSSGMASSSC